MFYAYTRLRYQMSVYRTVMVTIYEHGSHLGHMTSIMLMNLHFLIPESLHIDLVETGLVVQRKTSFNFDM